MPFVVLGTNAIFAYLASGLVAKLLHVWTVAAADGTRVSWWEWAQQHVFAPLIPSAPLASLVHSSVYALLWIADLRMDVPAPAVPEALTWRS